MKLRKEPGQAKPTDVRTESPVDEDVLKQKVQALIERVKELRSIVREII